MGALYRTRNEAEGAEVLVVVRLWHLITEIPLTWQAIKPNQGQSNQIKPNQTKSNQIKPAGGNTRLKDEG
jgi:hypothetical protein